MKTLKTVANEETENNKVSKKGMRKFLRNLQPSSEGKENLVGAGRTLQDMAIEGKTTKPEPNFDETEVCVTETSTVAEMNESLYKQLLTEDLTSKAGPSEKYWEVIAERRRKALEEVLEANEKLQAMVNALEEENKTCKQLIENTTDLVNTLKQVINESQISDDDDEPSNEKGDSGLSTPDSYSSVKHIHKKMKTSHSNDCSDSD
ncbi:geminin-like isoform X1 [Rhopalosiphum padi]|uniref:geminin-like isoform X1 n=2 Tax=Rhopalosiphum padi TaxID=40932 RepID=UPI00298E7910|nr:geminin-like isoform X1 [Rhopalosiphum padi]